MKYHKRFDKGIKDALDIQYDTKKSGLTIGVDIYGIPYPVNYKLRWMYPNSYFLYPELDGAIISVKNNSVIYCWMTAGYLQISTGEGISPDLKDRIEGAEIVEYYVKNLTPEDLKGKTPPTIYVQERYMKYWQDDWDILEAA